MAAPAPAGHRRNKSSVLRSILIPNTHKRSPSDGTVLGPYNPTANLASAAPLLPPDHPHSQPHASKPPHQDPPPGPPSPRKSQDARTSPTKGLHKKTLSSVSLRSLTKDKDKEKERERERARERQSRDYAHPAEPESPRKPQRPKSAANLAAMFGMSRQPKDPKPVPGRDKENTTPPTSATQSRPAHTPIWAEFSSQPAQDQSTATKIPLNDQPRTIDDEIALYTPQNYSPSKQRNFFDYGQPSLHKPPLAKERPKSTILPGSTSAASFIETLTRKKSNDRVPLSDTKGNEGRLKERPSTKTLDPRAMLRRPSGEQARKEDAAKQTSNAAKRQSRVMAAVAVLNGRSKQNDMAPTSPTKLDPKVVDAEFEEVLESRNIPTHQRAQMRTLKLEVKADFVRTHKLDTPQGSRTTSGQSSIGEIGGGAQTGKPMLNRSSKSYDGTTEEEKVPEAEGSPDSAKREKRERPRSRTFVFNKGDSPLKKQKGEAIGDRKVSSKSVVIPRSPSSRSIASNASQRSVSKGAKTVLPSEFISYMKQTPKPENVEVGKLHKLRLLLRNETVEWVDTFIEDGGLTELVGLLHRIMEIEWREDHEDTLLHEVLRCLKGLCTADSALKQLAEIASTLYPALLAMLFDEEHKGPSDFTTREFIIQIIFAHISTAPEAELPSRAAELLKYLKDPVREKESSTVPFILQMHQPRPFQVWCKEITNVTKEVFWIFIHHLTVIPLPAREDGPAQSYVKTHFPGPRAIVPAAPYVGGVEWDATNYIATHLDLVNGLIASIPTRDGRNVLRTELKVSGFEKMMGHLRTCNPKYYGAVHDAVKVWVRAAADDEWDVKPVRMGPSDTKPGHMSPVKTSPKKKAEKPPQIQAPKVDLGLDLGVDLKFEDRALNVGNLKKDDDWF